MITSEDGLQISLVSWARLQAIKQPKLSCLEWLYAVPNGGKRSAVEAMRLVQGGVKSGIPDLQLDVARKGYHGLRLELKKPNVLANGNRGKCKAPDEEQIKCHEFLREQGFAVHVSNDLEELKQIILDYLLDDV
jgi:hypothetical protein